MPLTADDDCAQAVLNRWSQVGMDATVPGGLQRERLSSFQPGDATQLPAVPPVQQAIQDRTNPRKRPYASFRVEKGREAFHQTSGPYVDVRLVTIEVRGLEAEVTAALSAIRDGKVFNHLFSGLSGQTLQTQAPFMQSVSWDSETIREDPARKAQENIWIGTVRFEVWTQRSE